MIAKKIATLAIFFIACSFVSFGFLINAKYTIAATMNNPSKKCIDLNLFG